MTARKGSRRCLAGRWRQVAPVAVLALLSACSASSTPGAAPSPSSSPEATAGATPASASPSALPAPGAGATPSKVLVVVLENHGGDEAWRSMPYLRELGTRYGRTTAYRGLTHPSLPNYLALVGGSTSGVHDDAGPASHRLHGQTVFGQALEHQRTARTYAESMPRPCSTGSSGRYAVKHNPWAYFVDDAEQAGCSSYDVPMGTASAGALHDDVVRGTLPDVGLVVPDLCSDAHDCTLATADRWLRTWGDLWLAGPDFRAGRLAVVVTFDEDDRSQGNTVLTVVVHPRLHGAVVRTPSTHLDLSAWLSRVAGADPLRDAAGHPSLGQAFGLGPA